MGSRILSAYASGGSSDSWGKRRLSLASFCRLSPGASLPADFGTPNWLCSAVSAVAKFSACFLSMEKSTSYSGSEHCSPTVHWSPPATVSSPAMLRTPMQRLMSAFGSHTYTHRSPMKTKLGASMRRPARPLCLCTAGAKKCRTRRSSGAKTARWSMGMLTKARPVRGCASGSPSRGMSIWLPAARAWQHRSHQTSVSSASLARKTNSTALRSLLLVPSTTTESGSRPSSAPRVALWKRIVSLGCDVSLRPYARSMSRIVMYRGTHLPLYLAAFSTIAEYSLLESNLSYAVTSTKVLPDLGSFRFWDAPGCPRGDVACSSAPLPLAGDGLPGPLVLSPLGLPGAAAARRFGEKSPPESSLSLLSIGTSGCWRTASGVVGDGDRPARG
mmetsp:Transcript_50145/g.154932  ORF Transcript_50145/g.154932 Transcript_50145/m.154932 type:complete len:387 (-) Transcript_50145:39-1199(-)